MGQFGIISNNEEANKLAQGVKIGFNAMLLALCWCTSITGAGYQMLKDGEKLYQPICSSSAHYCW